MALKRDEEDGSDQNMPYTYYRSFAVVMMKQHVIDAVMMIHHICHGRIDTSWFWHDSDFAPSCLHGHDDRYIIGLDGHQGTPWFW